MTKMNYDEFKKEVKANMMDYLNEEYHDYEMKFDIIKKSSGYEYEALMIRPKDGASSVIPVLNITDAYDQYQNGKSFDAVMTKLADIRMNAAIPSFDKEDLFHFEKIRDRIFPRLVNTAANVEYLADKPHKDIEDLSILYAVRVSEDPSGFAEAIITDDLVEMWHVDQDEIHEQAMDNIAQRPPLFKNIEEIVFGGMGSSEHEIEDIEPEEYQMPFFVLTNQQKTKGAVMAISPKTMDRITARLGDVYVIPSSVDETLIVPKSAVDDVERLVDMVREVNSTEVAPQDRLSDKIYEYDSETHSLKIASSGPEQGDDMGMRM